MRFSLFYNFDALPGKERLNLYHKIKEQAIVADRLGFDAIWLAEQYRRPYGSMPSPLLHLARISSLTRNIEPGTAGIEAPCYHPLRLAEDEVLLDIISGGRVRLGISSDPELFPGCPIFLSYSLESSFFGQVCKACCLPIRFMMVATGNHA